MSENIDTETVYVTTHEDSRVMSEKVQTLAGSIYKEFEKVIKKYDEDVVKDLMPLVVGILEALDAAFGEKQELEVEIELLREDNEQLLTQYEREKQLRKAAEQKYLEMEDSMEGIRKELEDKVETLESILRMSEIKSKNTADLVNRLEEREQEAKNEYNKLHDRYTELFRSHMDHMERTKVLLGTDKLSELTVITSPRITKSGFNLRPVNVIYDSTIEHQQHHSMARAVDGGTHPPGRGISLLTELNMQQHTREEELTDSINVTERATNTRLNQTLAEIIASTPELEESHDSLRSLGHLDQHHSPSHNSSSVFEEIQATDIAEVDFAAGISEQPAHEGQNTSIDSDKEDEEEDEESKENDRDSVGDNFFGMCKELENLILENTELLATKNALNIVKDDLIAKIDILTSEQDVLREEIVIHNSVRKKLQDRIVHLEDELKKLKENLEVKTREPTEKEEEEGDVPMAQRKRFTRVEMARVLMERNQYKERLMELQEAVRWTELVRASKEHPGELETKKKSGVWNFFSELVLPSQTVPETSILAHKQIPSRHRNTLNAVLNPSLHHKPSPLSSSSSSSSYADDSPVTISLLPSLSSSHLSSLPHITLLPPHIPHSISSTQAVTVPVVLATPLPNLPPTPSGEPPPCFFQSPLPAPFTHTPQASSPCQPPESLISHPTSHTHHFQNDLVSPSSHTAHTPSVVHAPAPLTASLTTHTPTFLQTLTPSHTPLHLTPNQTAHTPNILHTPLHFTPNHTTHTSNILHTPLNLTFTHPTHTSNIMHTPHHLTTTHASHNPAISQTPCPFTNKPITPTYTKPSPPASGILTPTLPGIRVQVDHPVQHL